MQTSKTAKASRYLIYFILAVLPLERIPSLDVTHPLHVTVRLSQVAGLILIALNLPLLWQKRRQLVSWPWWPLVVFWLVCIVSAWGAADRVKAASVTAYTIFVGLLAWTFALRLERDRLGMYAKFLLGGALVTCAFAIYQFFGDLLGLSTTWTGLRDQYTAHVFGFPRVQSTGLEPLYYDDFLLIPSGLLIGALALGKKHRAAWAGLIAFATIIFLNVARGAMVAFIIMAIIGLVVAIRQRHSLAAAKITGSIVIGGLLAVGLIFTGTHLAAHKTAKTSHAVNNFSKQATNVSSGESVVFRSLSRKEAVDAATSSPILGVGPGNFGYFAYHRDPSDFGDPTAIVNNEPLEIWAETGTLGLLAFVTFAVGVIMLYVRRISVLASTEKIWAVGLGLALVGIAAQYQTFSTLYITHVWVAIGLLIGILGTASPNPATTK